MPRCLARASFAGYPSVNPGQATARAATPVRSGPARAIRRSGWPRRPVDQRPGQLPGVLEWSRVVERGGQGVQLWDVVVDAAVQLEPPAVPPERAVAQVAHVVVHVAPHPQLQRRDTELFYELTLSITQAALGARVKVPTATGSEEIEIKATKAALYLLDPGARRFELVADYKDQFASPYQAAGRGYIEAVIHPRETRTWLIRALTRLENKRVERPKRKHGNIPL